MRVSELREPVHRHIRSSLLGHALGHLARVVHVEVEKLPRGALAETALHELVPPGLVREIFRRDANLVLLGRPKLLGVVRVVHRSLQAQRVELEIARGPHRFDVRDRAAARNVPPGLVIFVTVEANHVADLISHDDFIRRGHRRRRDVNVVRIPKHAGDVAQVGRHRDIPVHVSLWKVDRKYFDILENKLNEN